MGSVVQPRPGNLLVVQAAPGVGKSTFALEWSVHLAGQGEPVLYLSFDTSIQDQAARLVARWRGVPIQQVHQNLTQWTDWLASVRVPMRFSDIDVSAEEIREVVEAERMWFGQYPSLIVVDNAGDLVEGEESAPEYNRVFGTLNRLARSTDTVVIALHHINRGPAASGNAPVRMSDGVYAGDRVTPIVLGLWQPVTDWMNVAVLKNRMGAANGGGELFFPLRTDLGRSMIWEEA